MALQPWIRGCTADDGRPHRSFNGAMALQPWIHETVSPADSLESAFNGAMALQPWIRYQLRRIARDQTTLQWSHGPSAMDTAPVCVKVGREVNLQWSHGPSAMDTTPVGLDAAGASRAFNGAMALQPWIRRQKRSGTPRRRSAFNGAMALQPWIHRALHRRPHDRAPSMEPWPFSHGYNFYPPQSDRRVRPSMKPWPFSHGYICG